MNYDFKKIPCFGVAGNFTGHLEQAGEDKDFTKIQVKEVNAPKAIFPTFIPGAKAAVPSGAVPEFLGVFPFDSEKIECPVNEPKFQIEPECALIFDAKWEGEKLVSLKPEVFGASNDCSIRKEGAKKISQKKNWGACSKGFSSNLISVDDFSSSGNINDYRIASFLVRDGKFYAYGEDSAVRDYSYIYQKLIEWMLEKFNQQQDEGPAENINSYLNKTGRPEKIMVSIGATRYTDFGEHNFLKDGDESVVVVYPESLYSKESILENLEKGFKGDEKVSVLRQKVFETDYNPQKKISENTDNQVVLKVSHLSKKFALEAGFFSKNKKTVYAVNDVSFEIPQGQTYGIVGESGCGKTTTARLLIQMYKQTQGEIFVSKKLFSNYTGKTKLEDEGDYKKISDFNGKELKYFRERVKYIFQDPARSLNPRMTVFNVLTAGLKYSSLWKNKEEAWKKCEKIIQEVGLSPEDLNRRPSEFSGGQRQRISIARGLVMDPDVMICDEVVSALDVSIQGQILNLLQELRAKRGLSFIFITHDLKVACYFSDKIGVMYRGVLVEEASASDFYETAVHPYTKLLFESAKGTLSSSNVEVKTTLEQEICCPFAYRCPKAQEKCKTQLPEFTEVAPGHKVRCLFL